MLVQNRIHVLDRSGHDKNVSSEDDNGVEVCGFLQEQTKTENQVFITIYLD